MKYFYLYVKEFDLYKCIWFCIKVVDFKKVLDFEESGKWEILF